MQLKVLRGLPFFSNRSTLFAAFSLVGAVALAGGCASELDNPDAYMAAMAGGGGAPPTVPGGTPGTPTGGSVTTTTGGAVGTTGGVPAAMGGSTGGGTAPPLPACVTTAFSNSICTSCHAPVILLGGLDLMGADVGTRLRDAAAKNMMATNAAACGTKLIDSENPAQSVMLKRISGTSDCGPAMPSGNGVTGPDLECLKTWIMSF
jgi:hypothetical protein